MGLKKKKDIRSLLRESLLLEGTHQYGCVMLGFDIPKSFWDTIQKRVPDDALYIDDSDGGFGRETKPHCTILYGLTNDVEDTEVKNIIEEFKPLKLKLKKISTFKNDDYDVLKFDVSDKTLTSYNKKLSKLPNENKYPEYKAHITIAYIKKGSVTDDMLAPLDDELEIYGDKVIYSKPDDTKINFKLK